MGMKKRKVYLWLEDRKGKSGYVFWKTMMSQIAPEDEFLRKRMAVIEARKKLLSTLKSGNMHYKVFQEIIQYDPYLEEHNIEQLAARLLFDLTRNTGFEVSKKRIGECWVKSCCLWENRKEDDVCGLDRHPLALAEKMECIYRGTSLHDELKKTGLEVML